MDIADHVILARPQRPFTGEEDFLGWCARRSVIPLDHARPLWRMEVIPGLPDGRIGVMIVVHHVVADGLRGVAMIGALLDPAPTSAAAAAIWRPEPPPTAGSLVADNLRSMAASIRRARPSKLPQRLRMLRALGTEHHRRAPPTCLTASRTSPHA